MLVNVVRNSLLPLFRGSTMRWMSRGASASGFSRRELIPLLKRIHPDLLSQEGKQVQNTNLKCIQNLYEVFDFLEELYKGTKRPMMRNMGTLEKGYDLSCHVKQEETTAVVFQLSVPESLSDRAKLSNVSLVEL